jgi:hypothetical protein
MNDFNQYSFNGNTNDFCEYFENIIANAMLRPWKFYKSRAPIDVAEALEYLSNRSKKIG